MENLSFEFLFLLALIAFFYASVGHGGASGYLALMAFFSFSPGEMRSSALLLNIFVSAISFLQFYRNGNFSWKIFFPFALLSIPMSFLGASIQLSTGIYKLVLGICLIIAALRITGFFGSFNTTDVKPAKFIPATVTGGLIGFISGMIGIGGGILLSPVIMFLRWANLKETATVSALFILVNSLAGFAGLMYKGTDFSSHIFLLLTVAVGGGLAGSYLGSRILNMSALRYLLSAVLLFAGIKLIIL